MDKETRQLKKAIDLIADKLSEIYNNDTQLNRAEKAVVLDQIANLQSIRTTLIKED